MWRKWLIPATSFSLAEQFLAPIFPLRVSELDIADSYTFQRGTSTVMRPDTARIIPSQDLCIFCASRLARSAPIHPQRWHRRLLHSTRWSPQFTATATSNADRDAGPPLPQPQRQDDRPNYTDVYGKSMRQGDSGGSGRSVSTVPTELRGRVRRITSFEARRQDDLVRRQSEETHRLQRLRKQPFANLKGGFVFHNPNPNEESIAHSPEREEQRGAAGHQRRQAPDLSQPIKPNIQRVGALGPNDGEENRAEGFRRETQRREDQRLKYTEQQAKGQVAERRSTQMPRNAFRTDFTSPTKGSAGSKIQKSIEVKNAKAGLAFGDMKIEFGYRRDPPKHQNTVVSSARALPQQPLVKRNSKPTSEDLLADLSPEDRALRESLLQENQSGRRKAEEKQRTAGPALSKDQERPSFKIRRLARCSSCHRQVSNADDKCPSCGAASYPQRPIQEIVTEWKHLKRRQPEESELTKVSQTSLNNESARPPRELGYVSLRRGNEYRTKGDEQREGDASTSWVDPVRTSSFTNLDMTAISQPEAVKDKPRDDIIRAPTHVRDENNVQARSKPEAVEEKPVALTSDFFQVQDEADGFPDSGLDQYDNRKKSRSGRKIRGLEGDNEENQEAARSWFVSRAERKKQRKAERAASRDMAPPTPILLPEFISIANLATALRVRLEDFMYRMRSLGFEETSNDVILDAETAGLIAAEFNYDPIIDTGASDDLLALPPAEDKSTLPPRPPVVTIMGHVDHGKTTLLDYLRKSSVAASEFGGITQHIGAFTVPMPSGKIITFLDTPGHAAFLSMRERGANVTDIVVLVVAADDSVKPQTIEAIRHAQAAKVPMIVAINKIDKPDANADRVKQDLARHNVEIEDFGGDTQVVSVSGKTGQGLDVLEENLTALADILDMRAETDGQAEGWILEASKRKAGRVATILVRRGTIRPGSIVVAGQTWAKVRTLRNEAGVEIDSAGPGTPAEIDGWREQPEAGDEVLEAPDEEKAKSVVEFRIERAERLKLADDMQAINESRRQEHLRREREAYEASMGLDEKGASASKQAISPGTKTVPLIIKADVSGSTEAVINSIASLGNEEVRPHIIFSGVGSVNESDIERAAAADGYIIAFNTPLNSATARTAELLGVEVIEGNIIYRLIDEVRAKLSELLPPRISTRVIGEAEIAQVFQINIKGRQQQPIAGCKVRNGIISKNAKVRVMRLGQSVWSGTLASIKNVKKDVNEMRKGGECGLGFDGFSDFHVGDQVQAFEEISENRYL
ncbi:hypothetical protein MMC25_005103 [Agyrium rufum]|nr:hypothetical protein [Agyrium rufum]